MTNNIKGITIELGGNVENLNSALKGVNKTAGDLQSELKQVQRQLKFNPGNTELLNQKAKILKESISATEQKLEHLKSVEAKVTKQFEDGKISPEKYRAFERELEQTEDKLKSLKKQAADFGSTMGQQFQVAGGKIKNTGDKINGVGQKILPVSAAAAGIGVAAVKAADNFESGMAKVSTIADTTQVPINKLKQSIMDLSSQTGISTSELTDGLYQTISAGVQTKDAMSVLGIAVKTAKGGFTDTSTAIDTLTSAMNAYHMKASDAAKVSDTLIATQNIGKTTVGELGQSLGNVIPTAAAAGVKFTDLMGSIAELTKQGMPTSEAITGIKTAISNVIKPSSEASKTAQKLGMDFSEAHMKNVGLPAFLEDVYSKTGGNISVMSQLFGSVEGLNAVTALTGKNQKDFAKTLDGVSKSAGTTNQAFQKMDSTGATSAQKAMNSMKNAAAKLGEALAPIAEKIASIITQIGKKLQTLTPAQQKMIAKALLLAVALAPVLIVGGQIVRGIGSFTDGLGKAIGAVENFNSTIKAGKGLFAALKVSLGPGGIAILIIAAIALIVVGIKHLWDTNKQFRDGVMSIWNGIKSFFIGIPGFFAGLWTKISGFFSRIPAFFGGLGNSIKGFFTGIGNSITGFFTGTWTAIAGFFTRLGTSISTGFKNAWQAVVSFFTQSIPAFITSVGQWFQQLPYNIGLALGMAVRAVINFGTSVWGWVTGTLPQIIQGIVQWFQQLPGRIWTFLVQIVASIGTWGSNMWSYLSVQIPKIINGIGTWFSQLPGKIWTSLTQAIAKIGNWGNQTYSSATSAASRTVSGIGTWFSQLPGNIWKWLTKIISDVSTWGKNLMKSAGDAAKRTADNVVKWFQELPGKMLDIGKNIVYGIWNGITSAGSWLWGKVTGWCNNFVNGFKKGLQIHSPSKLFADVIGKNIALGIGQGFDDNISSVVQSMVTAMPIITDSGPQVRTAMAAAYGGYSVSTAAGGAYSGVASPPSSSPVFNQTVNNYSPKALSPAESARLTRNATQQIVKKMR